VADEQRATSRISPVTLLSGSAWRYWRSFALVNTNDVVVDFVATRSSAPLVLVIVVSALLGFLIGWCRSHRRNDD